jgi:hypothetical protein
MTSLQLIRCTVMEKNRVGKELGTKNFIFSK